MFPDAGLKEGEKLLADMKSWDEDMVQQSQALQVMWNFPNKRIFSRIHIRPIRPVVLCKD
jgi:hypothetical protein